MVLRLFSNRACCWEQPRARFSLVVLEKGLTSTVSPRVEWVCVSYLMISTYMFIERKLAGSSTSDECWRYRMSWEHG